MKGEPPIDRPSVEDVQRALIAAAREQTRGLRAQRSQDRLGNSDSGSMSGDLPVDTGPILISPDAFAGYEVVREFRRGAQGVVYQAVQKSTQRRVAIKVMKEGPFASKTDKARFDREVQTLGQLKHPNIVAIHGTGIAAGHYYFVMDYISGDALDAHVASTKPTTQSLLNLFAKICDAVNAAHLRGILHRDLKPNNIRVDENGEPHVLDFGLARSADDATDRTAVTVTGQFVGSLPWASPEQADGTSSAIDVRSDVYSLGVMLYQLLSGRFPYEVSGGMRETLDRILHTDPAPMRSAAGGVDTDVETIVLKCLEKEPERRYQSAGELARDLRHYLAGEPIEAKRDLTLYVLGKKLRKHRLAAGIGLGFLVTIVVGVVASAAGWRKAASERDAAVLARAESEAVIQFLTDLLGEATPYSGQPQDVTVAEVLARADRELDDSISDRPLVRAAIHEVVAMTYNTLRLYRAAQRHADKALELRTRFQPRDSVDLAKCYLVQAEVHSGLGDFETAENYARRALTILQKEHGPRHADVASCQHTLGHILSLRGRLVEAESILRNAVEQRIEFLGRADVGVAKTKTFLASTLLDAGKLDEAERFLREVIEVQDRSPERTNADTAVCKALLAESLVARGKSEEALPLLQETLEIRRRIFQSESAEVANSLSGLCRTLTNLARFEEAESNCAENLRVRKIVYGDRHPTTVYGFLGVGRLYVRWPKPSECETPCVRPLNSSKPRYLILGDCTTPMGC